MGISEIPCRYYVHPTKPQGVCLMIRFAVNDFSTLHSTSTVHDFRPSPLCDLRVSLYKGEYLHLYVENQVDNAINFDATTTIYDDYGTQLYREVRESVSTSGGKTDILPYLSDLSVLLPNDTLVFDIKLDIFNLNGEWFNKDGEAVANREGETQTKFSQDLKNWIIDERPEEIVLKTKDDLIRANKALLCARSPVFRRMFAHPMREQEANTVQIDDVNGATLKTLVDFLCYGKANLEQTGILPLVRLYYAADKYEVLDLRKICAQNMLAVMTYGNAAKVLALSHEHSDEFLKRNCLVFIRTCVRKVMETGSWKRLKKCDPQLAVEVLESCLKRRVCSPGT